MRKEHVRVLLLALLVLIGVGYSALRSGLNINGTTHVEVPVWDVHFENYQETLDSNVTPTVAPSTPSGEKPTTISYEVTLSNPMDVYEFTVDVVNNGSMDVMIESFSSKLGGVEITPSNLPVYLEYSAEYEDETELKNKQELKHNTAETIKIRIAYRYDILMSDLPETVQDLTLGFEMVYVQDDGTSIPVRVEAGIENDTWDDIIKSVEKGRTQKLEADMAAGKTRAIGLDLNNDGSPETVGHLRIANLSTPAECKTLGFSQTACGLVLEFSDIITTHNMNSSSTNAGGWPASGMRTYLNDESANAQSIINALPEELRSKVIPTYSVSGHGSQSGAVNYTSTDKIYLFSTKEVGFDVSNDSSKTETRTLDYYAANNTNAARIKKNLNNSASVWWLRAAFSSSDFIFFSVNSDGSNNNYAANSTTGVSPAFRIGNQT